MKDKIKEWAKTKGKKIANKWIIFFVMMLVALAMIVLILPFAIALVIYSSIYIIAAGFTAMLNEIFYRKPVDETFEDLYERLLNNIFGVVEF